MIPRITDLRCLSGILEELRLSLVQVEEWILIQRVTFDLRIDEEPYHSVQIYANMETRKYVVRVWGRTSDRGEFSSEEDLRSLCVKHFENTSACVGYLGSHPGGGLKLVQENFPCSRWISNSCAVTFSQATDNLIIGLCPACSGTDLGIKKEKMKEDNLLEEGEPPQALVKGFLKQELYTEDVGDDSSDMNFSGENGAYNGSGRNSHKVRVSESSYEQSPSKGLVRFKKLAANSAPTTNLFEELSIIY